MNEFIDIISGNIVGNEWDAFWNTTDALKNNTGEKPVLVISSPIAKGSEEETVLQKLLQACDGDVNKFCTIQLGEDKLSWHKLRDNLNPKVALLIGIHPIDIGIGALFQLNAVNNFDERYFVVTNSIAEMQQNPNIKTVLWNNALKPIFKEKNAVG